MEKLLRQKNITPDIAMELSTNEAVKQAIMAGIGISLISSLSLVTELPMKKIAILDLEELPLATQWHLVFKKDKMLTPIIENFLDFLTDQNVEQYLPE